MSHAGIIVAGGSGTRMREDLANTASSAFADIPKQYWPLGNRRVIDWSILAFVESPLIEQLVIVADKAWHSQISAFLDETDADKTDILIVEGGLERQQSVLLGLKALNETAPQNVLIHDAARPGLRPTHIETLIKALGQHQGVCPTLPLSDAIKSVDTLQSQDRNQFLSVQTPQAFHFEAIFEAHQNHDGLITVHDDMEIARIAGLKLTHIKGDERLRKLTYPTDFDMIKPLLDMPMPSLQKTGSGYDVHAFEAGNAITLCGIKIPHSHGLKGHSDADVAWHALTDAILGALALGDIGDHFPPSDAEWKNAPSSRFLEFAQSKIMEQRGRINNLDLTIICEAPKIKPFREAMRQSTAKLLSLDLNQVSIKATTTEGLGFEGRKEGIAAQAIISLSF